MTAGRRFLDVLVSLVVLILAAPLVILSFILIWLQDFHSPLYLPRRIGLNGQKFTMFKLRSMVPNADLTGVDSTGARDSRLTRVGRTIRAIKLDEIPQFWNVLIGDMTLVGPRPNVERETRNYSDIERELMSVKPGITGFSSIVFADLGEILEHADDADIAYNQLVRPWKSRFELFYIEHAALKIDLFLIALTLTSIFSKKLSRRGVAWALTSLNAPRELINIARREESLVPTPPPGFDTIVTSRNTD